MHEPSAPGELAGVRVIALPAEIDNDNADTVVSALTGAVAVGVTLLVADMSATSYCNLEGVHALVRARRVAEKAGAQLRLAGVQPLVREVLDRTGVSRLLLRHPSPDADLPASTSRPQARELADGLT